MRKSILNKVMALLLVLVMTVQMLPMSAFAANGAHITVAAEAPTTAQTTVGGQYVLDLTTVFADGESHSLTYSLDKDYGEHTKIDGNNLYYTASEAGEVTVTVTAACESGDSASHAITVTSVAAQSGSDAQYGYNETAASSVKVTVTISNDGLPLKSNGADGKALAHMDVEVPYFDLASYGLESYYRYGTNNGQGEYINTTVIERPTLLHLYIYMIERYYMGLPEAECGKGTSGVLSYAENTDVAYFDGTSAYSSNGSNALTITGSSTSLYMSNFWGHSENLLYYRNHLYPLISDGWGATADYILLSDGDDIDLGMFSNWNFYQDGAFIALDKEEYEAEANTNLTITTYEAATGSVNGSSGTLTLFTETLNVNLYDSEWGLVNSVTATANGDGTYTLKMPETAGTYYVMASDSNAKTEAANIIPGTAKVTVTASTTAEPEIPEETLYEITVNVAPSAANVTFYAGENAETALTEGVTDNGVVGNYHQYVLSVPEGTYSYRGIEDTTDLGGMSFKVPFDDEIMSDGTASGEGLVMTLVRANYYTTNKAITAVGDYSLRVMPGTFADAVCGAQYIDSNSRVVTPVMVVARGNALVYQIQPVINGELAKSYTSAVLSNVTFSASLSKTQNKTFTVKSIIRHSITAPAAAKVQMFNQLKNFNVEEIQPETTVTNDDTTVTYTFATAGGNTYTYRVSMDGKITRAGYMGSTAENLTFAFDESENPKTTENKMDNSGMAGRIESSTMLNVNGQNDLNLSVGGEFRLRAYRAAWQIINSDTANIMIEPDFHYNIISGGEHISMETVTDQCTGNATNNWVDITGVSAGTAIIEVSYDAIIIGGNGTSYDGQYGATDPQRTSLFVINVGGADTELAMTADGSSNLWDTEYDTVYFTGDTGSLTFSATVNSAVPDKAELSTDKGNTWTEVAAAADGTYTANGLVGGNNILRFTKGDAVAYQVVRAAKVTYTVTNLTREENFIYNGDKIKVVFDGLYTPVSKFSGIYNPGFGQGHKVTYTLPETASAAATGGQYNFITTNTYTVVFNADGEYTLSGGHIAFNVMGVADPLGGHRLLTDNGTGTNFSAVSTQHTRSVLPELTFTITQKPTRPVTITADVEGASIVVKNADGEVMTGENGAYVLEIGSYRYEVSLDGYITERASFTVSEEDAESIAFNVALRKVEGNIWDGVTQTEVTPNADGVYEISTGAQLAWFASQVNAGTGKSWNAVLTEDISLGGFPWTPIGTSSNRYMGTFDGNGHKVTDLYINSTSSNQGLFGYAYQPAVIENLSVYGEVTTTNSYAGGITGYLNNATVKNCANYANVTGKQNVGGISGQQSNGSSTYIINCYNRGNITATTKMAGGISGGSNPVTGSLYIENCYSTGTVTTPANGGALTPCTGTTKNKNSYYLTGAYSETSAAGTEKTADELKALAATLGDAYVADYLGINDGYPVLTWQVPQSVITATFDKDYYEAGETVTVKMVLTEAEKVNALGYSVKYDANMMTYVSSEISEGFTGNTMGVDKNAGTIKRTVYTSDNSVLNVGEEGVVFETLTFIVSNAGTPAFEYVIDADDVDFDEYSVCVMVDGVYAIAQGKVAYDASILAAKEAAASVDVMIDAIGTVTEASGETIAKVRAAYDALSDLEKQYVTKLDVLESAEAAYDLWSKGDVNMNNRINLQDMSQMLYKYNTDDAKCDINIDAIVNSNDFSILLTNYGARI